MPKILIIGSLGMLGQDLLKVFPNAVGCDRPSLPPSLKLRGLKKLRTASKNEIDITDKGQVEQKIKELKPEVIINAAAYNAVDKCDESQEQFEIAKKINGLAVGYLADVCQQIDATLVHYSTNYVFAGSKKEGYNESDESNPINKYSETKLLGEQKILRCDKLKYYIIRTSRLFGQKGKSEMAKDNFFNIMLKMAEAQDDIRVVDDELSSFTYTPDLAQATKNLLEQKHEYGIYHIVNEGSATWYEAAKVLFDILDKDVKLIRINSAELRRPAKRPRYSVLLNTKLPSLRNWQEALKEYLNKK